MADTKASWLAKLEQQPWFGDVAQQFRANGVQDALWQSTLYVEDQGLDPSVIVTDTNGAQSVGLFQLNKLGVGKGYANTQLQNPVFNAKLAAAKMGAQLTADDARNKDLPTQLQSIEKAGWNGSLAQDPARQKALGDVLQQHGQQNPLDGTAAQAASALGLPSTEQINEWIVNATVVAILLGVLAGGFALLAAPTIAKAAPLAAA